MKNAANAGIAERALQQDYDEQVAHDARRWIFDQARDPDPRPFLLVASFTHPHDPYVTPQKFWDLYRHDDITMPRVPFIPPPSVTRTAAGCGNNTTGANSASAMTMCETPATPITAACRIWTNASARCSRR